MAQLNKHSALPLKAQNKGSKMKIEELVNSFFFFSKLSAAYFKNNLLGNLKKIFCSLCLSLHSKKVW